MELSFNLFWDSGEMCKMVFFFLWMYLKTGLIHFWCNVSNFTGSIWRNEILKVSETSLWDEKLTSIYEWVGFGKNIK